VGQFGTDSSFSHNSVDADEPLFWRVADGVHYTEVGYSSAIRPPLLSDWEIERATEFKNSSQRDRWLAARTVAKALVRERLKLTGIIEIRDRNGQPLIYRAGLPVPDAWLSVEHRFGRIAAIIADRPIALDVQRIERGSLEVLRRVVSKSDARNLQRVVKDPAAAHAIGWAAKEAALKALRIAEPVALSEISIDRTLGVTVGDRHVHLMGIRILDHAVVAIVGRPLLHEQLETRVVVDALPEETQSSLSSAIERSMARARRISEARARWQRLRWQT
jgi:phosphopantetheinyl transferase